MIPALHFYKTSSIVNSILKMRHLCFSCLVLPFLLFFISPPGTKILACTSHLSTDMINQTCKKCADSSSMLSYNFCSSSLQVVPASHVTNLQGLAIISMELSIENATDTISSIKNLLNVESLDPFALACLEDCLELYSDAVETLTDGVAAFLRGQYSVASGKVSKVMDASSTCEEGFKDKEEEVSPLTTENHNLFQLSEIALCIIHLLSVANSS